MVKQLKKPTHDAGAISGTKRPSRRPIFLVLITIFFRLSSASKRSPAFIGKPDLVGAKIIDVQAEEVHSYSATSLGPGTNDGGRYTINFCNITVTHTHPGWNDTINTQALGGGGYSTGFGSIYLTYAVSKGFASASTDGDVAVGEGAIPTNLSWALSNKENVNWFLLEDYASKATNDMAVIGKQVTKSYYQAAPSYSYFSGCSGGGRQGLIMAQNYPDAFDDIMASSPAIHLEAFIPAGFWPEQLMNQNGVFPPPCEVEAFTAAAVKSCDRMDGVEDGIISSPNLCTVQAHDFVGQNYTCNGTQETLSAAGARIVQAAWPGSGKHGWFGLNKDTTLSSSSIPTECRANGTCYSTGSELFGSWISYLIAKDPDFVLENMTNSNFFDGLRYSTSHYAPMLAGANPDLSGFKTNGGKMIAWHGLADEVIPHKGSEQYYEEVLEKDEAYEFFRFFEAPGVGHCYGGLGPVPNDALAQLMEWVEKDVSPDTLAATKGTL
ncbi:uncharacterized protein ASPGLDRAFT_78800 [Aspergillus glaucus CBS 516.65]|uniref:Carboxylic ester hydrolase n=1 Tax=Aspergillus glaucus CBS 516.65 TaxID=1160497 RepID=A0A1L9VWC0_ASPGL|nr:hypothetical protein ASPGLDRAFT_78800 [Aspergillus glaucus CBS 516.65]OJJ88202.1 hypothetical protein ASPGLDRAFT_78800 [Aspergillus glaucus CBS 516.65]